MDDGDTATVDILQSRRHSNRKKNDFENDWGRTIVVQGLFPLSKMVVIRPVLEDCTPGLAKKHDRLLARTE